MNVESIEWPKFMPQFYTAPNANLRFKNEYNYDIADSYSIGIAHLGKTRDFHVQKQPIYN
jgi:hypothetical protein